MTPTSSDSPASALRLADPVLFLLAAGLLMVGCWSESGITGQDEYWLSLRTPLEMLERGSWWTPWLNDQPRLEKPPLFYWLIASSYSVFGPELWAARLWSVLAGAGLAVVAARISRRLFGGDGLLAGLLATSAVGVAVEARRAMLDLPMGFLSMWSVSALLAWREQARRPLGLLLWSATLLGLAMLIKGPVALLFVGGFGVGALVAGGAAPARPRLPILVQVLLGLLVIAALVVPWPVSMAALWPEDADRVVNQESGARHLAWFRPKSIGPVLGGSFGSMVPWSLALLGALWAALRGRDGHAPGDDAEQVRRGRRLLLWWCLCSVLPFLFIKTFERYLIPLVCPLAVWTARYLETVSARAARNHGVVALGVLGLPVLLLCGFALWFGTALWSPLITLAAWGLALRGALRGRSLRATALAATLVVTLTLGVVYPTIGVNALPGSLPAEVLAKPSAVYIDTKPAMLSIRQGRSVLAIRDGQDLGERLAGFDGYVYLEDINAERFEAAARAEGIRFTRAGEFRSFYARKVFLRFHRKGAGWPEWREALSSRSLDGLQPRFFYYRVSHD